MIRFDETICSNLEEASTREWLETNGLGGFASSTITGLNTRRYHGLLTAATRPPVGRLTLLEKLEETLIVNGERFDLSANQYPGAVHPQGYRYLKQFRLDPFPIFVYEAAGAELEKSVFMVHGENTTVVQYKLNRKPENADCRLELHPLVAFRDYHATMHENGALNAHVQLADGLATIQPYADLPQLHFAHNANEFAFTGYWYRNFEYAIERERGLDFTEDLFNHFALKFDLNQTLTATVIASTQICKADDADQLRQNEIARRQQLLADVGEDELIRLLTPAADQFIVARGKQKTVIAGYHWFSDWGRDTMIALPGLTLTTGRYDIARSILLEFAQHVDQGMLPNRFPDAGEAPEYNTVDATLWYFEAVRALIEHTGDVEFVRQHLYSTLVDILNWHEHGTRYNIHVDADGLLFAGEPGVQLTWMDAKVGDWVVTPRIGKPVEIQALWFNALRVMAELAEKFDDRANAARFAAMADKAQASFNQQFWNEAAGCLYDVVDGELRDGSIRPNQILAVSLHHSIVDESRAQQIVAVVQRELLTPYGLRSLSPHDPQYIGECNGDMRSRDGAYHQGTVWGWLIGPFITAYRKANGNTDAAHLQTRQWINGFLSHLSEAGLGQVSEIFDGDAPHTPRGCVAQAWSVSELLRVAVE
ncbi:MAG TPA: amylo-alpha-1,6-glucosidase [Blastocatellia bacterium]|nr:amylo-alpha-1,6-glucosidase [Blastocatellia bacterium]HMV87153.1 amylo-alpha-1,6-glucosidase [Blastocatellia bacterium]HMX27694.1 amylo-alpha-1,6-glucosidase [Blastocatellia bacterium]HMY73856.1 amylo-alpha-1,6-glucosidase [Blastocatellia bacterium]HMZ22558.1 amylo-alpha-1,6-glucosidase [Blastocatellia bacterium]